MDCGAFTGDTIEAFLAARRGTFKEIVGIEPDAVNCRALQKRIDDWKRSGIGPIRVEPVAVGSHRGTLKFETTGTAGSSVGSGTETVEVAPLDELLANDKPTYIKFDVQSKLMRSFSTTSGRLWTWVWIEPMYSPSTPMKKSCTAPKK